MAPGCVLRLQTTTYGLSASEILDGAIRIFYHTFDEQRITMMPKATKSSMDLMDQYIRHLAEHTHSENPSIKHLSTPVFTIFQTQVLEWV